MREKIIYLSSSHATAFKAKISIVFDTVDKVNKNELDDIERRLKNVWDRSVELLFQKDRAHVKGALTCKLKIYDSCARLNQDVPLRGIMIKKTGKGGGNTISGSLLSSATGVARLHRIQYKESSELKFIPTLEHEFGHCIALHWLGKYGEPLLPSFKEGLAEALAHETVCYHKVSIARGLLSSNAIQLINILHLKHSQKNKDVYRLGSLMVTYMLEHCFDQLKSTISLLKRQNFNSAHKKLQHWAKKEQKGFEVWIRSLQMLGENPQYRSTLYCPLKTARIDSEKLEHAQEFLRDIGFFKDSTRTSPHSEIDESTLTHDGFRANS